MEFLEMLRALGIVATVLGLLAGALYFARKKGYVMGGGGETQGLAVVGRVALTAHHSVHLVRAEWGTFLIATHQNGCTLIDVQRQDEPQHAKAGA